MQEIERPTSAGETKSEQTACKILNRVSTSNSTEKNIFVTKETIKTYGRELRDFIATLVPEQSEKIRSLEIE